MLLLQTGSFGSRSLDLSKPADFLFVSVVRFHETSSVKLMKRDQAQNVPLALLSGDPSVL